MDSEAFLNYLNQSQQAVVGIPMEAVVPSLLWIHTILDRCCSRKHEKDKAKKHISSERPTMCFSSGSISYWARVIPIARITRLA